MPHNRDDMYYHPSDAIHYVVKFMVDGSMKKWVLASEISLLQPTEIDWLWVVEQNRYATPDEIRNLCKA